jgi:hypothetical protein
VILQKRPRSGRHVRLLATTTLVVALCAGAAGCLFPVDSYRERITATVSVAGRTYTTSSVIEVYYRHQPPIQGVNTIVNATGDAVVLDVPGHSPVFILLTRPGDQSWAAGIAYQLFKGGLPEPREGIGSSQNIRFIAAQVGQTEIPRALYPTIVAFRDVSVPSSVYPLNADDLSPALGDDAKLVKLTVEMTQDPITYGVAAKLPWINKDIKAQLDGQSIQLAKGSFANSLGVNDFQKRGT